MSKELQLRRDPVGDMRGLVEKSLVEIGKALPAHLRKDEFARTFLTTFQRTPALWECDKKSVLGAFFQAAQLGVQVDGVLGECYLVPYRGKSGVQTAQFILGYKGIIKLMRQSGEIASLNAALVYDKEPFQYKLGMTPVLEHQPLPPKDRGEFIAAYSIVRFKDGSCDFHLMWREEIDKIKASSQSARFSGSPWNEHYEAMARKTVIRHHSKTLPLSKDALNKAIALDETADVKGYQPNELFPEEDIFHETMPVADVLKVDVSEQEPVKEKPKATRKKKESPAPDPEPDKPSLDLPDRPVQCKECGQIGSTSEGDGFKFAEVAGNPNLFQAICDCCEGIQEEKR